jgi:hypothetical protein
MVGQTVSGDCYLVKTTASGALAMVADGLGHGEPAARASDAVVEVINSVAADDLDLVSYVRRCHERLVGDSHGVVMSMASFDEEAGLMTWLGIGNVAGVLFHTRPGGGPAREFLIQRRGVVGSILPTLTPFTVPVVAGDVLVLATDGVRQGFAQSVRPTEPPHRIAKHILEQYALPTDDALVLVVRYLGRERKGEGER